MPAGFFQQAFFCAAMYMADRQKCCLMNYRKKSLGGLSHKVMNDKACVTMKCAGEDATDVNQQHLGLVNKKLRFTKGMELTCCIAFPVLRLPTPRYTCRMCKYRVPF